MEHNKKDVVIIGAGSAGISALRQVQKFTDNYLIIDQGPLGTKCARTGCMPSKALISIAKDYHRRKVLTKEGIEGANNLHPITPLILQHVRSLRDNFTNGMIETTKQLAGDNLVKGHAEIISSDCVNIDGEKIETDKIIIATGSSPKVPNKWKKFGKQILTSENIFEQKDLPNKIAVIGLGPIGLELGQALSRLGIDVTGFTTKRSVGKISDSKISSESLEIFQNEFPIYLNESVDIENKNGCLYIKHSQIELPADAVLVAVGVEPNIEGLGLENLGFKLEDKGLPSFNEQTAQIEDLAVFIAGDVNNYRPILHEALDEGYIAGQNCFSKEVTRYCRRVPFNLVFSDPQIAMVGFNYGQLAGGEKDFVIGEAEFWGQSRSVLELRNKGLLHIYIEKNSSIILGAELFCPEAEHLAHQLAMAIQHNFTAHDMLKMPFYHPTVEESLRTALRDAVSKLPERSGVEGLSLCDSTTEKPLS